MPCLHHDGIAFHYQATGRGPAVVFTHGLTGDVEQPKRIVSSIPGHQMIVWDIRAHGRTEPLGTETKLSFYTFADDLRALLDYLGIENALLAGISMGAGVASSFACRWPQRVSGLLLVRPAWLDRAWPRHLEIIKAVAKCIDEAQDGITAAKSRFQSMSQFKQLSDTSPKAAKAVLSYFDKPQAKERNARLWRIPGSAPVQTLSQASRLKCPSLVIGCEDDPLHPYDIARAWARSMAGASLIAVPSAVTHRQHYEAQTRALTLDFIPKTTRAPLTLL